MPTFPYKIMYFIYNL